MNQHHINQKSKSYEKTLHHRNSSHSWNYTYLRTMLSMINDKLIYNLIENKTTSVEIKYLQPILT